MILLVRRSLLNAVKARASSGELHPTIDNPGLYRVRSAEVILPHDDDWFEGTTLTRQVDGGVRLENFVTAEVV